LSNHHDNYLDELKNLLQSILECEIQDNNSFLRPREIVADGATRFDEELVEATANSLKNMIKTVTESVEQFIETRDRNAVA